MKILESHIVPAISEKVRLQEYAVSIFTSIQTRSALKKAIKKGLIAINGQKAKTGDWIQTGQRIELYQPVVQNKKIFELNIEVLYQDEFLAVVHKPSGYPSSGNYFRTIENALPHNLTASDEADRLAYPLPAHRLDNPTSGILLCAKTKNCLRKLQQAFARKEIEKTYYAVVHGKVSTLFSINSPVANKNSESIVIPLENYRIGKHDFSLVELKPLTGRTHQLRIHLSENCTPIVGDKIYGKEEKEFFNGKNLYLFAGKISFRHPITNRKLEFQKSLPKKFRNLDYYRAR